MLLQALSNSSLKLADLANLTQPWAIDVKLVPKDTGLVGFKNTTENIPIALEDLEREYCRLAKQPYPIKEMVFARSWMLFRVCFLSFHQKP